MGYVAAFAVVLLLCVGIYCFGYASRKAPLLYVLFLETVLGLLLIYPLLLTIDGYKPAEVFTVPQKQNWLWLSAAAFFGFVGGNYFSLWNLRVAGEKTNSLLSPAITALTIALSYFVFKDYLLWHQWLGVLLALCSIVWFLGTSKAATKQEDTKKAFISSVATVLCISFTIICSIKGASENISSLLAIWLRLLVAFVVIAPLFLLRKVFKQSYKQGASFYLAIITGVIAQTIGAAYLWLYASFHISIAVFQTILASLPLFIYAIDVYGLKKSKASSRFILTALLAGAGILLAMLS